MSLPQLLLVDDSEAILAYEQECLAGLYQLSTASNGVQALQKIALGRPAAVLLDLSMPELDGDEVLARMKADPALRGIPVIIVSSERERGHACVRGGAEAFLEKPIRAGELRAVVDRVLEAAARREREGSLAILAVRVGEREVGLPLQSVHLVTLQPATRRLEAGAGYLGEVVDLGGRIVALLDLARPLRASHRQRLAERKLVVIAHGELLLALSVDQVHDPEELPAGQVVWRAALGGDDPRMLARALTAVVRTSRGLLPVIEPGLLFSRERLRGLGAALESAVTFAAAPS